MLRKTVTPLSVRLVEFHSSLSFENVISRLDKEVNKAGNLDIVPHIRATRDQNELQDLIHGNLGQCGFLYFRDSPYHSLVEKIEGKPQPRLVTYIIGNPLIAQSILKNSRLAALDVPIKLLVAEKPENEGSVVAYYLPSSIMPKSDQDDFPARDILRQLDEKLEGLVNRIVDTE